jgi:hypothetical protein
MKARLEYNLPEDQEQFDIASKSMDWALLVWDIEQFMRNKIKYDQDTNGVLQLVRDRLHFQMEEKGLQFPE